MIRFSISGLRNLQAPRNIRGFASVRSHLATPLCKQVLNRTIEMPGIWEYQHCASGKEATRSVLRHRKQTGNIPRARNGSAGKERDSYPLCTNARTNLRHLTPPRFDRIAQKTRRMAGAFVHQDARPRRSFQPKGPLRCFERLDSRGRKLPFVQKCAPRTFTTSMRA
jgi:hypothetical protein